MQLPLKKHLDTTRGWDVDMSVYSSTTMSATSALLLAVVMKARPNSAAKKLSGVRRRSCCQGRLFLGLLLKLATWS